MPSYWQCSGYFVEWQEWRLSHCRDDSISLSKVRGVKDALSSKSKFATPPHHAPSPLPSNNIKSKAGARSSLGLSTRGRPNLASLRSEYCLVTIESRYKSVVNVAAPSHAY